MKAYRVTDPAEAGKAYPCAVTGVHFWAEGLPLSREWFAGNLGQYVEAFHLADDAGQVIGHIYWAPSERALVPYRLEDGVAFLYCDMVLPAFQGQGYGRLLHDTWVEYLRSEGYKGILVDSTEIEEYMHYSHYAKRGFRPLSGGPAGTMYLPLRQESVQIERLKPAIPLERTAPVEVLVVGALFCPVGSATVLYLRRVAQEFGGQVALKEVPAGREAVERYGVGDGIFVNGQPRFFGPVTETQVRETIRQELGQG